MVDLLENAADALNLQRPPPQLSEPPIQINGFADEYADLRSVVHSTHSTGRSIDVDVKEDQIPDVAVNVTRMNQALQNAWAARNMVDTTTPEGRRALVDAIIRFYGSEDEAALIVEFPELVAGLPMPLPPNAFPLAGRLDPEAREAFRHVAEIFRQTHAQADGEYAGMWRLIYIGDTRAAQHQQANLRAALNDLGANAQRQIYHDNHFHISLGPVGTSRPAPAGQAVPTPAPPGSALLAAEVGDGVDATSIAPGSGLDAVIASAQTAWAAGAPVDALDTVRIEIADLGGVTLGTYADGVITLDDDAAGHGWFVDPTPGLSEEFSAIGSEAIFRALAGGSADGRIDLFTVLAHEMGHGLGLDDVGGDPERLMTGVLPVGARRLPTALDFDALTPEQIVVAAPAPAAQAAPTIPPGDLPRLLAAQAGPLANGAFDFGPGDGGFAWTTVGDVAVENGAAVLREDRSVFTGLSQSILPPPGAETLRFDVVDLRLSQTPGEAPDAFEVALLDAATGASLLGPIAGLGGTDAFLNVQADGARFFADGVQIAETGEGFTVSIDLSVVSLPASGAALSFDLIGLGAVDAVARIDDVAFILDGANNAPIARDDIIGIDEDGAITVDLLANDEDPDGDAVQLLSIETPQFGALEDLGDGRYRYTPDPDASGEETLVYEITDGFLTATAALRVTVRPVNDAPILTAIADQTLLEGETLTLALEASDVDDRAVDLRYRLVDGPADATVDPISGALSWTPSGPGSTEIAVAVRDPDGAEAEARFQVAVAPLEGLVAQDDVVALDEDGVVEFNVLSNDAAAGGGALSVVSIDAPSFGALTDLGGGAYRYTPDPDRNGVETLSYVVTDGGETAGATVTITVRPANDAPTIAPVADQSLIVGQTISLQIAASDVDDPADALRYRLISGPAGASVDLTNGIFAWTPAAAGAETVTIEVDDQRGGASRVSFTVTVEPALVDPLQVTAVGATATGFTVRFNLALDRAAFDLTDFTLSGALVGLVEGAVTFDADSQGFRFDRAGGLDIQYDVYGLTLASGAAGVLSAAGGQLDGDGDGTVGDDYFALLDLRGTGDGVVSAEDFMRGPGQPVDEPTASVGLPVLFESAGGVKTLAFAIDHDPYDLTITGVVAGADLPSGAELRFGIEPAGWRARAVVVVISDIEIQAGPVELVRMVAHVPTSALYRNRHDLKFETLHINGASVSAATDTLHVVGYVGDLDADGALTRNDVITAQRMGFTGGPLAGWEGVDPLLVGDLFKDGRINAFDGSIILQEISGFDRPEIPNVPTGVTLRFFEETPDLRVPLALEAALGGSQTVAVRASGLAMVSEVAIRLAFDAEAFEAPDMALAAAAPAGSTVSVQSAGEGLVDIVVSLAGDPGVGVFDFLELTWTTAAALAAPRLGAFSVVSASADGVPIAAPDASGADWLTPFLIDYTQMDDPSAFALSAFGTPLIADPIRRDDT